MEYINLQKILVIEDEPDMILGLRDNLEYEGYAVITATNGEDGITSATKDKPDLILLDVMLPKLSGLDVCRQLRRNGFKMPIIMLTARSQEADKVVGLEIGADDYVTKPFGLMELLARIRAHLRRSSKINIGLTHYSFGDIVLDFERHTASKLGRPLDLSPREFDLLKFFIKYKGEVVTRDQLLDEVWGLDDYPFTRTVDNHVSKLRRKIETSPNDHKYLITVHRFGYKFLG